MNGFFNDNCAMLQVSRGKICFLIGIKTKAVDDIFLQTVLSFVISVLNYKTVTALKLA